MLLLLLSFGFSTARASTKEILSSVSGGVGGTISPSGASFVTVGNNQTYTMTTSNGYALTQVLVDNVNNLGAVSSGSYTFTNVTAGHTIVASFTVLPTISGTVTGPSGPIYSAFVSVSSNSDGSNPFITLATAANGNYTVTVPSFTGTYYLIAQKGGSVTSSVLTVVMGGSSATGQNFYLTNDVSLDPLVVLDASTLTPGALTTWTNTGSLGGTFNSITGGSYPTVASDYGSVQAVEFTPANDQTLSGDQCLLGTMPAPKQITGASDWTVYAVLYQVSTQSNPNDFLAWAGSSWTGYNQAWFSYEGYGVSAYNLNSVVNFSTVPGYGAWHKLAYVYDGNAVKVYVDGQIDSTTTYGALNIHTNGEMLIGGGEYMDQPNQDQYWRYNGGLQKLEIFDQALTADQVATLAGVITYKWSGANNGNWSNPANWSSNTVPAAGNTATFSDSASAGATVQLDAAESVKGLEFNNLVPNTTIASSLGNTLTFDDNSGGPSYSTRSPITVDAGSATISAGVVAYAGIESDGPGKVTLSGSADIGTLSAASPALVVQGGGTLELAGPTTLEFTLNTGVHGGGTLIISGAFTSSDADQKIGDDFGTGPGYLVLKGTGSWTHTGTGVFCVGVLQYPGTVTINDSATLDLSGQDPSWGSISVALGYGGGSTGTVIQNGGTVRTKTVGEAWNGNGGPGVMLGNWTSSPCTAEYDLNGGVLITPNIYNVNSSTNGVLVAPNGSAVFKFNGGVLQGTQDDNQGDPQVVAEGSTNLMGNLTHAYVETGGAIINTATFGCGINQSLEHDPALGATLDGGLTVQGSGTLTLYQASTYTGPTKVQGGVLACALNTALGKGSLDISTGASVALNYSGTRTISQLTFNGGAPQPNGTYGATGSGATTIDNTHFSGAGTVTLSASPTPMLPLAGFTQPGGVPTFTFNTVSGYKYQLVYKNNLTDATWTAVSPGYVTSTGAPMTVSDTTAASQPHRFYRLEAANP